MAKNLLEGIVDKETGNLLNRKGEHVKHGSEQASKVGGSDERRGLKLTVAIVLLLCAAGALVWSLSSGSGGGIRALEPEKDVAGPDPTKVTRKNEKVEVLPPNRRSAAPQ
ncbi:hypothetical protein [Synechococcus sp. Cruz CV-v-12]|uniref:hypothetical protein n=1 Tax=Synechococcus sp. Cruz CV-v-12 TaxID=2823728 RepID=UPI0020CEEEA1|nr:hypothetical protein [Synechococcus sp. Cruz CV-v-12]MCP9874825.1 hypothetical protein [Synechococcus sp. Cruz CV-v-12]